MTVERQYHDRFRDYRQHGEWFLRTIDVEAEIARLSTPNTLKQTGASA